MGKVRVENIGDQILIVTEDNKNAKFYSKDKSVWYAEESLIKFQYDGAFIFEAKAEDFESPTGTIIDLLVSLNNMLLVAGSKPEKKVSGNYTLTNDDANYLILWDLSGGNATMYLPSDAQIGLKWDIKDTGNALPSTNVGTINGGGKLVEGSSTATDITLPYEYREIYLSEELGEYLEL